jgi:hypothetical protein
LTKVKNPYERVAEKAARGEFTLVEPLDYLILEKLPEEGTLFAGLYPLGETVANISKNLPKVNGKTFPSTVVTNRIRSMQAQGLTTDTRGATATRIWQRSRHASQLFKTWKEKQSGSSTSK